MACAVAILVNEPLVRAPASSESPACLMLPYYIAVSRPCAAISPRPPTRFFPRWSCMRLGDIVAANSIHPAAILTPDVGRSCSATVPDRLTARMRHFVSRYSAALGSVRRKKCAAIAVMLAADEVQYHDRRGAHDRRRHSRGFRGRAGRRLAARTPADSQVCSAEPGGRARRRPVGV